MAVCVFSYQRKFKGITEKHTHTCNICKKQYIFAPINNIKRNNTLFLQHETLHLYNICLGCSINKWDPLRQKYLVYFCSHHKKPLHKDTLYQQCFPRGCYYIERRHIDDREFQEIEQYFNKNWAHCCASPYIKHDKQTGELICVNCGTVFQQKTVARSVGGRLPNPMMGYIGSYGKPETLNHTWKKDSKEHQDTNKTFKQKFYTQNKVEKTGLKIKTRQVKQRTKIQIKRQVEPQAKLKDIQNNPEIRTKFTYKDVAIMKKLRADGYRYEYIAKKMKCTTKAVINILRNN